MSNEHDEMLEVLDDILDNGTEIPQVVSNRMLLAAIRKNYKTSAENAKSMGALESERALILATHLPRVARNEKLTEGLVKLSWALCIAVAVLTAAITWHTGIEIGWFPAIIP